MGARSGVCLASRPLGGQPFGTGRPRAPVKDFMGQYPSRYYHARRNGYSARRALPRIHQRPNSVTMPAPCPEHLDLLVVCACSSALGRLREALPEGGRGYRLTVAHTPRAATELLAAHPFDLALVHDQLAHRGCLDFLEEVRTQGDPPPLLVLTETGDAHLQQATREAGAMDCLDLANLHPPSLGTILKLAATHGHRIRQLERQRSTLARANKALRRLKATVDSHAIVSVTDAAGTILEVNHRFCQVSGYHRDELLGSNHRVLKSGQHPDSVYQAMWACLSQGESWHGELCNRRKDGGLYWIRGSIVPFTDDNGLPYRYVSIRTDITAIKASSTQARLMAQALEASLNGVLIADATLADAPLTYVNGAFEAMSGYRREALQGRSAQILLGDAREQPAVAELMDAFRHGRPARALLQLTHKDGSRWWSDFSFDPVHDPDGRLTHFVGIAHDQTQRVEMETRLRQSEERLRRSQTYANIGTWDWDIATGALYWSERIAPLFGYDHLVETTYSNFLAAIHPQDRPKVEEAIRACLEDGQKYDVEHRVIWPDGTVRWLLERGDVTRDPQGQPLHMLGVVQDISQRKDAEEKLAASQASLIHAQRIAHLGSWTLHLATGTLDWTDEVFQIFGQDRHTFFPTVTNFLRAVRPEDRATVQAHTALAPQHGLAPLVARITRPDGSVRHVQTMAELILDPQGAPQALTGTVQDITELKQAESLARKIGERFRALVETSADWIWETNALDRYTYASPRITDLLGYLPEEILGKTPQSHLLADDAHAMAQFQRQTMGERQAFANVRKRCRHRDGSTVVVESSGVPAFNTRGNFIGYRGIDRDVTLRVEREQQLLAAKAEAERANRAKSAFLSGMSHELRTPLNAILGFAQLMALGPQLDSEQRANVAEILKAGRHLLDLINDVLDLAKVESGRVDLTLEAVSFQEVAQDTIALMHPVARQHDIHLILTHRESEPVWFRADRLRTKQIIVNLLSNAIKYNHTGGTATLGLAPTADGRWRIEVTDTGPGIALDRQSELFQPFQRLDATHSDIEGTGIGLVITKRLAEAMGGRLGVISQPGAGSTFWLELPWVEPPRDTLPASTATPAAPQYPLQGQLLYIEDCPANQRLLEQIVATQPGLKLTCAAHPQAGLALARSLNPDIILLDLNLPDMDGYQVRQHLLADPATATIPVIAISASAMAGEQGTPLPAAFQAYLNKPIDLPHFLATLAAVLGTQAAPATS